MQSYTDQQDTIQCPHCGGPLWVEASVRMWGMRLRKDGTYDTNDREREEEIKTDLAYCGDCETEYPSISALVQPSVSSEPG